MIRADDAHQFLNGEPSERRARFYGQTVTNGFDSIQVWRGEESWITIADDGLCSAIISVLEGFIEGEDFRVRDTTSRNDIMG